MRLRIYRLAFPDQSLLRIARNAKDMQKGAGSKAERCRPCLAYESAELAAMCSPELLWNVRRKTEILRETLILPADADLHAMAPAALMDSFDFESSSVVPVMQHMLAQNVLTLWVGSQHAASQHAVFINPLHPAFVDIVVLRRQLVLTRPSWSGHVYSPDRMVMLASSQINEPMVSIGYGFAPEQHLLALLTGQPEIFFNPEIDRLALNE